MSVPLETKAGEVFVCFVDVFLAVVVVFFVFLTFFIHIGVLLTLG
ncbi:putative membrane protein [Chlamydia psittaci 84/55]|nr:putative membrane protein [Chlamydia psittaci 84/55]